MKSSKLIHDIQPDNMWGGFGQSMAMLNFMTTGLIYNKKIDVKYIDTGEYEVEVTVDDGCDDLPYWKKCEYHLDEYIDGKQQFEEEQYRNG